MRVGLSRRRARSMLVSMVLVVPVQVLVLQGFMKMLVLVMLARVQPDSYRHQRAGGDQPCRHGLAQDQDAGGGTDEWRRREVGGGPPGSQMSKRQDEEPQAHSVAHQPDEPGVQQSGRARRA